MLRLVLAAFLAAGLAAPARAAGDGPEFSAWLDGLRSDALAQGIGAATLDQVLPSIELIPRVIELDRRQPEFTLTLRQYLNRVVPRARIAKGRAKLRENAALLTEIGRKFGVQPRFIVAFWGVETDFGRQDGGFPVISALATLAHDGRRPKFFRGQLIRALRIVDQGHITYTAMRGSWAGAMGQFQFMPSSFERFAYDYNGDGRRDIWRDRADAFASAANFLSKSGWRADETWGRRIRLPKGFDSALADGKRTRGIRDWQAMGVRRADGRDLPMRNLQAAIVLPEGPKGPAYMVYNNYQVTLRWNRSHFFAIAIGTLADGVGGG